MATRILAVDDDIITLELIKTLLPSDDFSVTAFTNPVDALASLKKNSYDLILSDYFMPQMDGREFLEEVRKRGIDDLPFIFLTANTDVQQAIELIKAGADDYICKPFQASELIFRIGKTIKEKKNQRAIELFNVRIVKDLESAALLQRALLPQPFTGIDNITFDWIFNPCNEIGGDIFNIFKLDNDHIGIFSIDVSGHGVSAALLSFALSKILSPLPDQSSLIRNYTETHRRIMIVPPGEVAGHLNIRFPLDSITEQYFTLLYGILDRKSLEFCYVSAGHPPIIHHAYKAFPRIMYKTSPAIGFIAGFEYQEHSIYLKSGDRLYLYTDGIIETRNAEKQFFGEKRFADALTESGDSTLKEALQASVSALNQWRGRTKANDDIFILGIEIA